MVIAELTHRRARIIRTIASLQSHYVSLYTSGTRQCALGYDSSAACDSFQLGEMVKFLTKKGLFTLVPLQAVSPEDPEYVYPGPYTGDIEHLVGLLRQCPSYQIDKNHGHCGLRTKILPALDFIQSCIDTGIGIKTMRWKSDRAAQTWIHTAPPNNSTKKPFIVGDKTISDEPIETVRFSALVSGMDPADLFGSSSLMADKLARKLFTAETVISWSNEDLQDKNEDTRLSRTTPTLKQTLTPSHLGQGYRDGRVFLH